MSSFGADDEVVQAPKPTAAFGANDTAFGADDAIEAAGPPMPDERNWLERTIGVPAPGTPEHADLLKQMKEVDQLGAPQALDPTSPNFAGWGKMGDRAVETGKLLPGAARNYADMASFGLADKGLAWLQGTSVKEQRKQTEQWAKEHPAEALGTKVLGVATPGVAAAKVVNLGLKAAKIAPKLIGKMLLGGAGASAFNASSEMGHTDSSDPYAYLEAAKKGATEDVHIPGINVDVPAAALGAAMPVAGKLVGAAGQFVSPYFQKAAPGLGKGATATLQGVTPSNLDQRVAALGPQGTLADTGPGMLGVSQGVHTNAMGGPTQEAMDQFLLDRAAGVPARLQKSGQTNLGLPQDPEVLAKSIKDVQSQVARPLYDQIWASKPPPVNIKPILNDIQSELQTATAGGREARALTKAHEYLTEQIQGGGRYPKTDAQSLHKAKGEIDDLIKEGSSELDIQPTSQSRAAKSLVNVHEALNSALKQQVPGYADASAKIAEYFDIRRALKEGTKVLGSEPARPQTFQQGFDARSPAAQQATREGMLADIDKAAGTNINDLGALSKKVGGELDWNRQNMQTAFGQQPTQNFVGDIGKERTFGNTKERIMGGSDTAARLAAAKNVERSQFPALSPGAPTLYGDIKNLGWGLLHKGYEALRGGYHGAQLDQLGKVMLAPDSPYRQELIRALMAGRGASQRAGQAISDAITNPALVSQLLYQGRPPQQ